MRNLHVFEISFILSFLKGNEQTPKVYFEPANTYKYPLISPEVSFMTFQNVMVAY